ncbi:S-methyl-5-thioribose-1-phosphate isomerase [Candidatus Heimdallarchaeota archaeon B3_Heim]|nr:MAG: S-methyl-5-thioribose-1-phosphate isomerase [Candidatus Heimdallarchaeota archaeon B3_Heim]
MKLKINGEEVDLPAVWWNSEQKLVQLIDQTKLPFQISIHSCSTYRDIVEAIKSMKIRGAPSIGATAAYGLAQAINEFWGEPEYLTKVSLAYDQLLLSRPTAVDLKNGLDHVKKTWVVSPDEAIVQAQKFAHNISMQGKKIGEVGKSLIRESMNILTHCHTGALALVDHGSAIAPLIASWEDGMRFHVYVDETRPRMQGRLTSWELTQYGIDHTVICDSASGHLMSSGKVDLIILGADRVAKNGDIANKIGTHNLAVIANHYSIPFYSAFPDTTFDINTSTGAEITIEERNPQEIYEVRGLSKTKRTRISVSVYKENTHFYNPAFDVTPAELLSGYITPHGILSKEDLGQVYSN